MSPQYQIKFYPTYLLNDLRLTFFRIGINQNLFHVPFNKALESINVNIINGFSHCGLFPLTFPCSEQKFSLTKSCNSDSYTTKSSNVAESDIPLKRLLPSPKKPYCLP